MPMDELGKMKAESAIGAPLEFNRFEGVGDKTASKLRRSREFDRPKDIGDATVDELTQIEGIGQKRAQSLISQAGGNATRNQAKQSRTGSVSAAGIRMPVGDFMVGVGDGDDTKAEAFHNRRSAEAQRVDERRRAPVTTDLERWKRDPQGLDFPGVDTPSEAPGFQDKDRRYNSPQDVARDEQIEDLKFGEGTAERRNQSVKDLFLGP